MSGSGVWITCRRTTTCTGCDCAVPEEVDGEVETWLAEAYEIGGQRHVTDKRWERQLVPPPWVHIPS